MYSPEIIDRRLHAVRRAGHAFSRLPRDKSIERSRALGELRLDAQGELLPAGVLSRTLTSEESSFVASEQILCKADFAYFLSRYYCVEIDPGVDRGEGIGPARPLESQERFIRALGKREEVVHAEFARYSHTEGIRVYAHKCRQVMFTATSRALTLHRMLFWGPTRAFAGTLEPDGCGELYKRDKLAIDNLPWWLSPGALYPDVKDSEIGFLGGSRLRYQAENQKTGIGVGTQQDVSHLTEVPLWRYPGQIGFSFAPSLPKGRMTLHVQEGTSAGKGYWYEVSEACRKKLPGYESWIYIFVPWYMNRAKYRAIPPDGWVPGEHTTRHAELIERTSSEWADGMTVRPSREQLFWWETTRAQFQRRGETSYFRANYPATPEQSFVNFNEGALPSELLEEMEMDVRPARSYELELAA